jgi:hypothetical protein
VAPLLRILSSIVVVLMLTSRYGWTVSLFVYRERKSRIPLLVDRKMSEYSSLLV